MIYLTLDIIRSKKEKNTFDQSGLQTLTKCGLKRPTEYLAISVESCEQAQPNRNVPIVVYDAQNQELASRLNTKTDLPTAS